MSQQDLEKLIGETGSQRCSRLLPPRKTSTQMHRHGERHVFVPLPPRHLAYPPMGHQLRNFSLQPSTQTQRPYSGPVSAFHRAAHKSSRSAIRRGSSSLHVCIAWRIYYHKQLKKMHQKSNSLPQEMPLKHPITSFPDSEQPKESRPVCRHPYLDSALGSTEGREKGANISHNWCKIPEPHPFKPTFHLSCETQQDNLSRKTLEHPVELFLEEKIYPERLRSSQTAWDTSWDPRKIQDPDGKTQLGGCKFDDVKKPRQETEAEQIDPSSSTARHTDPSTRRTRAQQMSISSLCVSCHNGCKCIISYPGTELHPYQAAAWEQTWNHRMGVHLRQRVFRQHFCDRFQRFLVPRHYSPLALRCQDAVYLRGQDTLPPFLSLL